MKQHQRDSRRFLGEQCYEMDVVFLVIIIGDRRSEMGKGIHETFVFAPEHVLDDG